MTVKPLIWVGSSLDDVRAFPPGARRITGHQLDRIQKGKEPDDWKAMANVGSGVYELRVRTAVEHRVFYVAKFQEAIYVLHAFQKKSQRTNKSDIELARERLKQLQRLRREKRKEQGS